MGTEILQRPVPAPPAPMADTTVDEQLMLDLASVRNVTDWERLIPEGITPALVIGGERRSRPR